MPKEILQLPIRQTPRLLSYAVLLCFIDGALAFICCIASMGNNNDQLVIYFAIS